MTSYERAQALNMRFGQTMDSWQWHLAADNAVPIPYNSQQIEREYEIYATMLRNFSVKPNARKVVSYLLAHIQEHKLFNEAKNLIVQKHPDVWKLHSDKENWEDADYVRYIYRSMVEFNLLTTKK